MSKCPVILAVFSMLLTTTAPDAGAQPRTLQDIVQTVQQVNPRLQSLRALVQAKEGALQQASAVPNPEMGGLGGNRGLMLSLGQEFEYPGKRGVREEQAKQELEIARLELRAARLQVSFDAASLFVELLWAQKNEELLQENLRETGDFLEAAHGKLDQGFGGKLAVIKGQVESLRARRLLLTATNERLNRQLQLQLLLGSAAGDSFSIEGSLEQMSFTDDAGLDSLLARAFRTNPLLLIEQHRMQGAQLAVRAADFATKPNFNFNLSGGIDDDEGRVELGLSIPLALWDRKEGTREEASFLNRSAVRGAENTRLEIARQVSAAWQNQENARQSRELFEDSILEEAKSASLAAKQAFETSSFRFLDLIDAQRTYLEAAMEYQQTMLTLRLSEISLMLAVGDEWPGGTR